MSTKSKKPTHAKPKKHPITLWLLGIATVLNAYAALANPEPVLPFLAAVLCGIAFFFVFTKR